MKKLVALLMILGLLAGAAFSAEEGEKQIKKINKQDMVPSQNVPLERPGMPSVMEGRGPGTVDRQTMYRQMLSKRAQIHRKAIDELEAIRKIAEEESAPRTVEAIQKMIDEKDAEYKKGLEQFTRQQNERTDQIRQRTGTPTVKQLAKAVKQTEEGDAKKRPVE